MKIYSVNAVVAVLGAAQIKKGKATGGAFASIEKLKEDYTFVVGPDGEMTRMATGDNSYRVILRLHQTSEDNALLTAIRQLGLIAANGADVAPFALRDANGADLFVSPECFIEKPPNANYAVETEDREWPIICNNGKLILGGN